MMLLFNFLQKRKNIFLPALFLAVFIAIIILKAPLKDAFEFDTDEGNNLIKSTLFLNGFSLYREIWSDQPPLFTAVLSFCFQLFGQSIFVARLLVLAFSSLLLLGLYLTAKILSGELCGFLAVLFLIFSSAYLVLSISVMIGIPALSLAMLSILALTYYRKLHLKRFLVFSGILMALSLQTKLFTAFLIPIIIWEIIQIQKQNRPLKAILLWFTSFLVIYLAITVLFFRLDFGLFVKQLILPHYLAKAAFQTSKHNFLTIYKMLLIDYDIMLLALTSMVLLIGQKKWYLLFPVLWFSLAFLSLYQHKPIWDHHYLLISLPLSWLAAIGFGEFFRGSENMRKNKWPLKLLFGFLIILVIARIPVKFLRTHNSIQGYTSAQEKEVIALLSQYKDNRPWVVTDRPIFAFYAGMLVPPEVALTCQKRNFTDKLAQGYFISMLKKYYPRQILLNKSDYYGPGVISYIEKHYALVYQGDIPKHVWSINDMQESFKTEFFDIKKLWTKDPDIYRTTKIKLYLRKNINNS